MTNAPQANFVCAQCGADCPPILVTGYCKQCGSFKKVPRPAAGPCTLSVQLVDKDTRRRVFVQSFTATCIKYTSAARFAYKFNSAKDCEQSWVHAFHRADAPQVELAL